MNTYITGCEIKQLREKKNLTQVALAEMLGVSDKAVSKWETGRGYPDITFLEPLAKALGVSVIELLTGNPIQNKNTCSNLKKTKLYVCPVCGNVISSVGDVVVSCCGIVLPPLEAELCDEDHMINMEEVDGEYYVTIDHPMTKDHFISFIASVTDDMLKIVKLYPEMDCQARFQIRGLTRLYAYCNHHGLFSLDFRRQRRA